MAFVTKLSPAFDLLSVVLCMPATRGGETQREKVLAVHNENLKLRAPVHSVALNTFLSL